MASNVQDALGELASFPLVEALFGRRSRRFALGDEIPDGPLAYKSEHDPLSRRITWTSISTTDSSSRGPTSVPTWSTWIAGTSAAYPAAQPRYQRGVSAGAELRLDLAAVD